MCVKGGRECVEGGSVCVEGGECEEVGSVYGGRGVLCREGV